MYKKLQLLWNEMIKDVERNIEKDENIIVNKDKYIEFQNVFEKMYDKIKNENMQNEVLYLDRHKVAAIIIYSIVKIKVVEYGVSAEGKEFLGNYQLAFSAGLSYLQYELNQKLNEKEITPIKKFLFPEVMYGTLCYKDNVINMLFFSDKESNLNILELANMLFLLEQFNLLQK